MTREEWLANLKAGDEVCVTNTTTTINNIFGDILHNFDGAGTTRITQDGSYVEEICTITKVRAVISDGFVVDNNVYGRDGKQQTEQPVSQEGIIPPEYKLIKDAALTRGCEQPHDGTTKTVQKGELVPPTDDMKTLAGVLKFNSDIRTFNFREFDPGVIRNMVSTINEEIINITKRSKMINTEF